MADYQYTQAGRRLAVNTPLGDDALLLVGFEGVEEISRPFRFDLDFLSLEDTLDPRQVVGKSISFYVLDEDNIPRHFSGVVYSFSYLGRNDRLSLYRAEVVPWLSLLEHRHDCRIFQNKTAEEIVTEVFTQAGFHDFKFELQGSLRPREYCVQYRETDLAFVSRLLEEEGIFYFFEHEETKHTLVLADSREAYRWPPEHGEREVSMGSTLSGMQRTDQILSWEHRHQVCTGKWTSRDYDFKKPESDLTATINTVIDLEGMETLERYDYPGLYREISDGERRVRRSLESCEAGYDLVRASSMCRTYGPGIQFTIADHHNESEVGRSYVVRRIRHKASLPGAYVTGAHVEKFDYVNEFEAFPNEIDYRPPALTPRPRIYGAQTALVVGPKGEEIYADEYGRIKVKFHWDRLEQADESSSCWIRVAYAMAGRQWGGLFTPRIGHEVMVEFEEGDPDRPYVTGAVYNENNRPPYAPDKMGTITCLKTNSSKGGGGFNELRLEDKKGEEQIFVHGEKNLDIRIKNDAFELVGNDRHLIVKHDQIEHVENNREEIVDNDHKEKIGKDRHLKVAGKEAKEVVKTLSLTVKDDVVEVFKKNQSTEVTKDLYIKAANICLEATTNITIKVGQSHIAIDQSGIKIGTKGDIKLESTGPTNVKSTAPLTLESVAKADLKSPMTSVNGSGMVVVQGGLVKIN